MEMPAPDSAVLARKTRVVERLRDVLPADAVIDDPAETRAYECDALTAYRCPPMIAVLPSTTAEVSAVLRICHDEGVPVVPRGSGTSLAGGALPTADCVILLHGLARSEASMNELQEQLGDSHHFSAVDVSDDAALSTARLNLVKATQITLANTLKLMGMNAPERM